MNILLHSIMRPIDVVEDPFKWKRITSFADFKDHIKKQGLPEEICFGYELNDSHYMEDEYEEEYFCELLMENHKDTGLDAAKWLIRYCIDNKLKLPKIRIKTYNKIAEQQFKNLFRL